MIRTAAPMIRPSSDITSRSTPRRRTLGNVSTAAIDTIRAAAMNASPTALGEWSGSDPVMVTQTLAATASSAATTRSCHDRRLRPAVWTARS